MVQFPRRAQVAAAAVAALAAVSGCGGGDAEPPPQAGARLGDRINLADCAGWNEADVRSRYETVEALREFAGGSVAGVQGGRGPTLDDDDAYKLFESYCANDFARKFKLYKLYTRAAAFGAH